MPVDGANSKPKLLKQEGSWANYRIITRKSHKETRDAALQVTLKNGKQQAWGKRCQMFDSIHAVDSFAKWLAGKLGFKDEDPNEKKILKQWEDPYVCKPDVFAPNDKKRRAELEAASHFGWSADYGMLVRRSLGQVYRQQALKKWADAGKPNVCLLYTSPSPRDQRGSRMPSSA